jgi:hypothetical protein
VISGIKMIASIFRDQPRLLRKLRQRRFPPSSMQGCTHRVPPPS